MGYFTYDTKNFMEDDYKRLAAIPGFSCRESVARGERNRGMLVCVNSLMLAAGEVAGKLPEGYTLTDSRYPNSAGCIVRDTKEQPEGEAGMESVKVNAVRRELDRRGEQAAILLLANMTAQNIITKKNTVLHCLHLLLDSARADDFRSSNIFDIYQSVPRLRECYFENPRKQEKLQASFDKLVTGQLYVSDIANPFDRIYLQGLMDFLHIGAETPIQKGR